MNNSGRGSEFLATNLKTAKQWHLYIVFSDPDFISRVKNLPEPPPIKQRLNNNWRQPFEDLAKEFGISYLDVYLYKNHGLNALLVGARLLPKGLARYNSREDVIELKLRGDLTQQDFYELWEDIRSIKLNELGLKPTKQKPPDDPQLIYAIFKARKQGLTFKQIFEKYQNGSLDYYLDKPRNQFSSEDALQAYYHKYRPIT